MGNILEDKDYYDEIVCPLFSKVFNKNITAHEKKSNSVYGFYLCDKKIVNLFRRLGFSKRKTYNVKIPQEILKNDNNEIIAAFIRGFADCDGCLTFMKRKGKYREFKRKFNTYPRIYIRITSKNMIDNISHLLNKLNISHAINMQKKSKENWADMHIIVIRGKERVEKWKEKISFNNNSKTTKYDIWKKFGFCPTNICINQRKLILQNKLNPIYSVNRKLLNTIIS